MKATADIREVLLKAIDANERKLGPGAALVQSAILDDVGRSLGIAHTPDQHIAVLTLWNDLFRTGYLGWGLNLNSPNAPFFHVTERGRTLLGRLSRDPGNPAGYLRHLSTVAKLNPIAQAYVVEAVECFTAGLHKATAVMVGGAAESMALELRDATLARAQAVSIPTPKDLNNWKLKTVLDALYAFLNARSAQMPKALREDLQGFWPSLSHQIRVVRNDAGHPKSVDPVSPEAVHASLLLFPDLARMSSNLEPWISNHLR